MDILGKENMYKYIEVRKRRVFLGIYGKFYGWRLGCVGEGG